MLTAASAHVACNCHIATVFWEDGRHRQWQNGSLRVSGPAAALSVRGPVWRLRRAAVVGRSHLATQLRQHLSAGGHAAGTAHKHRRPPLQERAGGPLVEGLSRGDDPD